MSPIFKIFIGITETFFSIFVLHLAFKVELNLVISLALTSNSFETTLYLLHGYSGPFDVLNYTLTFLTVSLDT